jgi:aminoglycoside phosphotransferase (APT) family kinase protein
MAMANITQTRAFLVFIARFLPTRGENCRSQTSALQEQLAVLAKATRIASARPWGWGPCEERFARRLR